MPFFLLIPHDALRSKIDIHRRPLDIGSMPVANITGLFEECRDAAHFFHPNTPHKKLRLPEWYVSTLMMDRALDAVVRRVKNLDRTHDIPYLAGYSRDGEIIYIDRHMPKTMRYDGREIDTDRYLILHEQVEKTPIDRLNLHYLHAHQIASRAEQAAVRAAGISWKAYDDFMQKNVKLIGDERLTKVPADLDLKPYRDEHDYDVVQRMLASTARGQGPAGITAKHIQAAVDRHLPQLKTYKPKAARKLAKAPAKKSKKSKAHGKSR